MTTKRSTQSSKTDDLTPEEIDEQLRQLEDLDGRFHQVHVLIEQGRALLAGEAEKLQRLQAAVR